jgi:GNAT superfamily N-acetyltransferase
MHYTIHLTDQERPEAQDAIHAGIVAFNQHQAGPYDKRPLVIEVRAGDGRVIGGLSGVTSFGWLFVKLLVLPPELRGGGLGTELMRQAEQEALRRGCHAAWLDTFEFQARAFYERLGYRCFGELPDYPAGFSRFFMTKKLGAAPARRVQH